MAARRTWAVMSTGFHASAIYWQTVVPKPSFRLIFQRQPETQSETLMAG
jgi:hypothetical protein